MDATQPEQPASPVGPAIVLVGAAGFVVACFFPFYGGVGLGPGGESEPISLYRANVTGFPSGGFGPQVGGFVFLFAGVAIIASIAILLLRKRPQRWAVPALVAVVAAWSLSWFGTLLRVVGFSAVMPYREVGYWAVLLAVGVVTVGTVVCLLASRRRAAAPNEFDE